MPVEQLNKFRHCYTYMLCGLKLHTVWVRPVQEEREKGETIMPYEKKRAGTFVRNISDKRALQRARDSNRQFAPRERTFANPAKTLSRASLLVLQNSSNAFLLFLDVAYPGYPISYHSLRPPPEATATLDLASLRSTSCCSILNVRCASQ